MKPKVGVKKPKRFSIYYLDNGLPRIIRDRVGNLSTLLRDLSGDSNRQIVGIGSDEVPFFTDGLMKLKHNVPKKESVKWAGHTNSNSTNSTGNSTRFASKRSS